MAPTICSGKKRETRTIINTNIRRHGEGSHQFNQTLSNVVNYVAKGTLKPRVSASLRIHTLSHNTNGTDAEPSLNYNNSVHESTTLTANHCHRHFSFLSDNAVTSSTHSDAENSFDMRLANATFTHNSSPIYNSNTNSSSISTSLSSTSASSTTEIAVQKERISTSAFISEGRRFQRYVTSGSSSDDVVTDLYTVDSDDKNSTSSENESNQIHSRNLRKHYYAFNDFNSDEERSEELNADISGSSEYGGDCDTDMDTDDAESMTSLDTEKSAKLKRGNQPLLRDKLLLKQQTENSHSSDSDRKSLSNIRNTDGLLSIAIKTIKLVKRNQLLQQRLTQLQLETSEFIQSVLANPENRHFRENIKQCKVQEVENI